VDAPLGRRFVSPIGRPDYNAASSALRSRARACGISSRPTGAGPVFLGLALRATFDLRARRRYFGLKPMGEKRRGWKGGRLGIEIPKPL